MIMLHMNGSHNETPTRNCNPQHRTRNSLLCTIIHRIISTSHSDLTYWRHQNYKGLICNFHIRLMYVEVYKLQIPTHSGWPKYWKHYRYSARFFINMVLDPSSAFNTDSILLGMDCNKFWTVSREISYNFPRRTLQVAHSSLQSWSGLFNDVQMWWSHVSVSLTDNSDTNMVIKITHHSENSKS
jgi:hypothetical protein